MGATSGTVVAWGRNDAGQTSVPVGLTGVIAVAAGSNFSLAVKKDGAVLAWGDNYWGQSTVPPGLSGVVAIAAGGAHSMALKQDGTVVVWGDNRAKQTAVPVGLGRVIAIAAGSKHSVVLKQDGTVVAWGWNEYGQCNTPSGLYGEIAIAACNTTVALKQDGTVVAWGLNFTGDTASYPTVPAGLSGVVAIAAGANSTLALKQDGTVVAWQGVLRNGAESIVPVGLSGVAEIAAGYFHSVALNKDGTVVAWGANNDGQTTVPASLSGVVAISAGAYHTVALKQDGTVVAWGMNDGGQATVPASLSGVVAIAGGAYHTVALKQDGTVVAWGMNDGGQATVPASLSGVVAIAAGSYHAVALKQDGTVVTWGHNVYFEPPTVLAGLSGVVAIAAGLLHTVVIYDGSHDMAPTISQSPAAVAANLDDAVTFSVGAIPSFPAPSYQWRKDSVDLSGANSSVFSIVKTAAADIGSYDVVVSNYLGSAISAAATLTVNPAAPASITVQPANATATVGDNIALSFTATGSPSPALLWFKNGVAINGATSATYTITGVTIANAGTYTATATNTYNGAQYKLTTSPAVLTVNKITPAITWPTPAAITYGTALSATQLNATSSVAGTFVYMPAAGTVLNAGVGQTLGVAFTPTDTTRYNNASGSSTITVNKVTPQITWPTPAAITYGTALSATQLNTTSSVAGTFVYMPAAGRVLNAGIGQTLGVAFTPTDTTRYNNASGSSTITVNKMPLTVTAANQSRFFGAANPTLTINYTGFVNNDTAAAITPPTASTSAAADSAVGNYPITLTGGSAANYTLILVNGTLTMLSNVYLANFSVRAAMTTGQTLIVGFVVDGGAKPILVRAAGPVLNNYGLTGVVDPRLGLYNGGTLVASNENWDSSLSATFATLGAFAFDAASKDAALQQSVNGPHTAQATATGPGAILVEAYDAGPNDGRKLVNLSTRFQVGTGDNVLIAGFVLSGTGTKQLLIRAVGPTLASYGVTGTLVDPQLAVYDGGTVIASNDNWSSSLTPTFDLVGAFHLLAASKDAAIVVTLQAGKAYTVQVSGVGSTTGEALVEIYAIP